MREIVLDTETTGFEPYNGDRIVEIGCLELYNHVPTGNYYHQYINPERDMPESAFKVHGLTIEFLKDKPVFKDITENFLAFIQDSSLVIHNAEFDMKFINAELSWLSYPLIPITRTIDTLKIARSKFPGMSVSLDALCKKFSVDNSKRSKHGALLDAELLAEVYLELIGGREPDLVLTETDHKNYATNSFYNQKRVLEPRLYSLSEEEKATHQTFLQKLNNSLWLNN